MHVEPTDSVGPRPLEKQTETAVVRDYLQSLAQHERCVGADRANLLDPDFIGAAKEKLAGTIRDQAKLGIHTRYRDTAHDIQLVFYSLEGLLIQLVDRVDYSVQILDGEAVVTTQEVRAHYVAVLTPTEVRRKYASSRSSRRTRTY